MKLSFQPERPFWAEPTSGALLVSGSRPTYSSLAADGTRFACIFMGAYLPLPRLQSWSGQRLLCRRPGRFRGQATIQLHCVGSKLVLHAESSVIPRTRKVVLLEDSSANEGGITNSSLEVFAGTESEAVRPGRSKHSLVTNCLRPLKFRPHFSTHFPYS